MRAHEQDDKAHLNKTANTVAMLREQIEKLRKDIILREETLEQQLEAKVAKMRIEIAKLSREKLSKEKHMINWTTK